VVSPPLATLNFTKATKLKPELVKITKKPLFY
jgi:hypothetical protein